MYVTRFKSVRILLGVLQTFSYLSLKLLFKNPSKARSYPRLVHRAYMSLAGSGKWLCKDVENIIDLPPGTEVTLEYGLSEGKGLELEELTFLALLTKMIKPGRIFEIGTFRGRTTVNLARNAPDNCALYTLDLPPELMDEASDGASPADEEADGSPIGVEFRGTDVEHKIEQLLGDSVAFEFSPYSEKIDLVFVDGGHSYAVVKADTENALGMVKPGGFVVWHDFAYYGDFNDVTRAVLEALPGDQVVQVANTQLAVYRSPTR